MLAGAVIAALLLSACPEGGQRAPAAPDDGLQLTGQLRGAQVNVSDGEPEVLYGNCRPTEGRQVNLCIAAHTIDGDSLGLVVDNPEVLRRDAVLPVRASCPAPGCSGVALVEVRRGAQRFRVTDGTLAVTQAGPRYAASFTLRFSEGTLNGSFDVRPPATP